MWSQNITGKIYDDKTVLQGVTITNINSNIKVSSDENGNFKIKAKVSDSLKFHSLFHKPFAIQLKPSHFEALFIVELKKIVHELDEVLLSNTPEAKPFKSETYQANLKHQIAEDIKKHPYKYAKQPSGNIDFVAIAKLIGKLFKNKRPKPPLIQPISYQQIDSLFKKDDLFNDALLMQSFNIPIDYKFLFFEYCETKHISNQLIFENNRLELLEVFHRTSLEFHKIIKAFKQD